MNDEAAGENKWRDESVRDEWGDEAVGGAMSTVGRESLGGREGRMSGGGDSNREESVGRRQRRYRCY